jgi:hypothetical protein
VADDDAAVRAKLAALEAEVKADADAQRARKEAALAKLREQRAAQQAERDRQLAVVAPKKPKPKPAARAAPEESEVSDGDAGLGGALELATKANQVKNELARKPGKGGKSWKVSGIASLALGPIGWLYAGSLRESVPASAGWILLAALASKILPTVLLMPVLLIALPLSAIAGIVYALQYNKHGGRQRLFGDKKEPKQLRGG